MAVEYRAASAKVGLRIRRARQQAGLSQEALARNIKTSRRNVLRWEGGHNMPRAEHIRSIAEATGKSTDYFLGEDEEEEAALHRVVNDLTRILLERRPSDYSSCGRGIGLKSRTSPIRLNRTDQVILPIARSQYAAAQERAQKRDEVAPDFFFIKLSTDELKTLHKELSEQKNKLDKTLHPLRELFAKWLVGKALDESEAA